MRTMRCRTTLYQARTTYIDVLSKGTHSANDRPQFTSHLARAAEIFSAIHREDNPALQSLIASLSRSVGWSYLSSPEGDAVEAAWQSFASVARDDTNVA